jgi:hypothetical protein
MALYQLIAHLPLTIGMPGSQYLPGRTAAILACIPAELAAKMAEGLRQHPEAQTDCALAIQIALLEATATPPKRPDQPRQPRQDAVFAC